MKRTPLIVGRLSESGALYRPLGVRGNEESGAGKVWHYLALSGIIWHCIYTRGGDRSESFRTVHYFATRNINVFNYNPLNE